MEKYFTFFLILLANLATCQEEHLVKATTNTDARIGEDFLYGCSLNIADILKPNTDLILYGYLHCEQEKKEFYKVFHNGLFLVEKSEVNISEADDSYLRSLNADQELILSQKMLEISRQNLEAVKKKAESLIKSKRELGLKNGILIKKSNVFDQSEYTSGTGYDFALINTGKKTIKYIWITVKGINPVNDVVSSKTLKCIGPLEPNHEGSYSFDYVWYTDVVETCKISLIKIQYMDGSIKQLANAESLKLSDSLYEIMFGSEE
jgi:hypothetical protein